MESDEGDDLVPLTPSLLRQIVRYSVVPYVRELMLERGRDPSSIVKKVVSFFETLWKQPDDDDGEEHPPSNDETL